MRYLVLSVLAAFIIAAAAVPLYGHQEIRVEEAATVEVVSESGGAFLSIPHKDFRKGGPVLSKSTLRPGRAKATELSFIT